MIKPLFLFILLIASGNLYGATIEAVFLAQTHVMKPDQPYFRLTGNRDALLKVHVVSPNGGKSPVVTATIQVGSESTKLTLKGPATLPKTLPSDPGVVNHRMEDSFNVMIPAKWVRKGLEIELVAGTAKARYPIVVGAPSVVPILMFDIHYFGKGTGDYPNGFLKELEAKWPVAGLDIERVRGINFMELVIPARGGLPATRISSPEEYMKKTGGKFDGEQAAALQWVGALSRAGANNNVSMCYVNILGANAGGQAGNFNGVGTIRLIGIMHHELGHALGLPHAGEDKKYPYRGEMFGIQPPNVFNKVHVGPTWAFDLPSKTFIAPTVQTTKGKSVKGQYRCDPMQGGGDGDQDPPFLLRHFSDFSVHKMQMYIENRLAVYRAGAYYKWDDKSGTYSKKIESNGLNVPIVPNVPVVSVMAGMGVANKDVNIVYPPIGPYRGNIVRTFDPRMPADRQAAKATIAAKNSCDFTLKVTQGKTTKYILLPTSTRNSKDPSKLNDFATEAVNLPAEDGAVKSVELLLTLHAEDRGIGDNPEVLARWPKK
jgi:hypothetical protein